MIDIESMEGGKRLLKFRDDIFPRICFICKKEVILPFYYCKEMNKVFCCRSCAVTALDTTNGEETEKMGNPGGRRVCGSFADIHEHFYIIDAINIDNPESYKENHDDNNTSLP